MVCPRVPDNFISGAVFSCAEAQIGGTFGKRDQLLTAARTALQGEWRHRGGEGKAHSSCDNVTAFFQLSSCGTALTSKPNTSPRTTSRKRQLGFVSTRQSRGSCSPGRGAHTCLRSPHSDGLLRSLLRGVPGLFPPERLCAVGPGLRSEGLCRETHAHAHGAPCLGGQQLSRPGRPAGHQRRTEYPDSDTDQTASSFLCVRKSGS